ncbi:MAG: DUF58 domain-containing protein [Leptospiraceae bacterium]|nr:DUF58 domain-containing protein [Leptospiraceae bacterium]
MILKELEKLIQEIELKYKKKIRSNRAGSILVNRSGRGMDFKESRVYMYGDDIRFVDWNVSSRMGELYVKLFHEENDRTINLFLDISKSMSFSGANSYTKFFIGFQFLAFITLLSLNTGDKVNIILYSDKTELVALGIKSKAEAYRILRKVNEFPIANKTNHLLPLQYLKNKIPRNSISYIISDFAGITDLTPYKTLLGIHELYGIRISDPIENLDNNVLKNFFVENIETNSGGIYSSSYKSDSEILEDFFRSNLLNLKTDSDLGKSIVRFLNR